MNYRECSEVGDSGVELVMRWMAHRHRVFQGRMVRTDKGRIAMQLQATVGDVLFNPSREQIMSIEVKTDQTEHDNLFLETYSNADPERLKPGWLETLNADWLFYYFTNRDLLCTVDFQKLKEWAFRGKRGDGTAGRIYDFKERAQGANRQLNKTRGCPVPIAVLEAEVGLKRWRPRRDLQEAVPQTRETVVETVL